MITFERRKKDILSKKDKSDIERWDKEIMGLCNKINKSKDCYTTSSCSGRIVLIRASEKKEAGLFLFRSHEKISFSELKKELLKNEKEKKVYFKMEPVILHIACRDIDSALAFLKKAAEAGFKRAGIISAGSRVVCEIMGSEKLELPIIYKGILVNDEFLKVLLKEANNRLEKTRIKIKKLERLV